MSDEAFGRDVLSSSRPVLVVFFLEWSAPCQMQLAVVDELSDDLSERMKIVRVNAEASPTVVAKYGLTEFPTMMIFKAGRVEASRDGAIPKQILLEWINQSA